MILGKARLHLVALLAAAAFLVLWPGQQAAAQGFNPDVHVELDGYWENSEEHIYINSNLYANDVMFDAWVQFTPPDWVVASDAQVDDGAYVGGTGLGLALGWDNSPCNWWNNFHYDWHDATTTGTVFTDTGSIPDGTWNGFDDVGGGVERAVVEYPGFLTTLYPAVTPHARYYSHEMWGDTHLVAQLLIFDPGQALPGLPTFDPGLGYPSVIVTQDPTAPPSPSDATDVCTNWNRNDRYFNWMNDDPGSGVVVRQNPPGGWYAFNTFARGRPDADGDSNENDIDTCPFDPDWDENPRGGNGPDGDGLDSACDPEWDVYNDDQDGDGYLNRGDNCPLDPNGCSDSACGPIWNAAWDNQDDNDGDGIGNACDTEGNGPDVVDGDQPEWWFDFWVEVSGDWDEDGFSDALEHIAGSDSSWDQSTPEGLWRYPMTCSDTFDNDLDGLVDGYDMGCDADDDGVANMFDACPDQQEDWDGFQDADGCPDDDNDLDGVWDWNEDCLDTNHDDWCDVNCDNLPEDYDSYRDWDGCPDTDNDDDGFPDVTDECPATDYTVGPDGEADTGDEPHNELGVPIQTKEDYDGIIDWDGCHDSPGDDYDDDGFSDEVEVFMGTDPADACTDAPGHDAWPPDISVDRRVDITDVLMFAPTFPSAPPSPQYTERFEFSPDGVIDITDVLIFFPYFPNACTNP